MKPEQNNKILGKVLEYNGNHGFAASGEEIFIIIKKDIKSDNLKVGDYVLFMPEVFIQNNQKYPIARFIEKTTINIKTKK